MKLTIFLAALAMPTIAAAYATPNHDIEISTGDLVDELRPQPMPSPVIVADNAALPPLQK